MDKIKNYKCPQCGYQMDLGSMDHDLHADGTLYAFLTLHCDCGKDIEVVFEQKEFKSITQ